MKGGSILALICALGGWYYLRTHFGEWIQSAASSSTPSCLEMLGSTTSEEDGVTNIVGNIKNNCDRKYLYVQVVFTLDNSNADPAMRDMPEPKAVASVRDLEAGATMPFKTAIPVSKNATYRLDGITAY